MVAYWFYKVRYAIAITLSCALYALYFFGVTGDASGLENVNWWITALPTIIIALIDIISEIITAKVMWAIIDTFAPLENYCEENEEKFKK